MQRQNLSRQKLGRGQKKWRYRTPDSPLRLAYVIFTHKNERLGPPHLEIQLILEHR